MPNPFDLSFLFSSLGISDVPLELHVHEGSLLISSFLINHILSSTDSTSTSGTYLFRMPLRKQQSAGKPPSNSPQASFFKNPFKKGSSVISDGKAPSRTYSFFHRLKRSNTVRPRLSKKAVKGFTQAAASPSQIDNELTTSSTSRGDFSPSSGLDAHKSSSHPPPPASPISDATEDTSSPGQQPSSATDLSLDTKGKPPEIDSQIPS